MAAERSREEPQALKTYFEHSRPQTGWQRSSTLSAMQPRRSIVMLFVLLVLASSCATANPAVVEAASAPGFWWGLLHGAFAGFAFLVSLFDPTVGVYEVANSGGWYDFGFVFGLGTFSGGCSSCRKR